MANVPAVTYTPRFVTLADAYQILKHGIPWSAPGPPKSKCTGYATANPGEASKIDAYVAALNRGERPTPPALATDTGRGLVGMLGALAPAAPTLRVTVSGTARQGEKLTGAIA